MKEKFKISLLENGIHSFNNGLDKLLRYKKEEGIDDFQLKESIMFLHHGIELLFKEILIRKGGEYLIFEDIKSDTVKKIIKAKKEGVSVFNLDKPIHTATYLDVIQRVQAFVDNPVLEESLETRLIELNKLRNHLEHYGIDIEKSKVLDNLLFKLHNPIVTFFKKAGIELGKENQEKWDQLEKQLLLEASRLRGGGSIKKAELIDDHVNIEYVANYEEYKKLQPQSLVTEKQLEAYWKGNTLLKAIIDGGVRLMRKFDEINEVSIKLPFKEKIYSINVNRKKVEEFLGHNFEEIKEDWDNTFSHRFVYSEAGREAFFKKFGKVTKRKS